MTTPNNAATPDIALSEGVAAGTVTATPTPDTVVPAVNPDRPLPTKREFLAGLTPPLAKSVAQAQSEGKRGGGRLSKAAHERIALELANPAGQRFADA